MSHVVTVPVVAEQAHVSKRRVDLERVSVTTVPEEERFLFHDEIRRDSIEVMRVPVERAVAEAPQVRTEGDVTIVPVVEERLVVEKRLFVVEELHLRRRTSVEPVELPVTLRRTRVEIEREDLTSRKADDRS